MGIKTIVNLRAFHSDKDEIGDTDLSYEHIRMKAWRPKEEEIIRFLKIVTDKNRTPVFIHCLHGSDRTGTMCAIYRIVVCGWTKKEAIKEMKKEQFGFHKILINLPRFIKKLDIDKIKKKSGIKK
jgi:protein tyrosine/serine phosphatase